MSPLAKAREAGVVAQAVAFHLLGGSSPEATREAQRESLTRAFTAWPVLCRLMAELEAIAPNCAQEGQQRAGKMRDFIEGRGA